MRQIPGTKKLPILALRSHDRASCQEAWAACERVLENRGVVIIPTDTVYGLACRSDCPEAIERIFALKRRPADQPLALLVARHKRPCDFCIEEDRVLHRLLERWWPGPLTVVAPAKAPLPSGLAGKGNTVGLRAPDHDWLQGLLHRLATPLAATSANISGRQEVTYLDQLDTSILAGVDLVVDAGPMPNPKPSTVIANRGDSWIVVRHGAIPPGEIERLL